MSAWIALLRGVNVGGNNVLPMKELTELIGTAGGTDVKTYVQSGNAVFRSSKTTATQLATRIAHGVAERRKFKPSVLVLSIRDLEQVVGANPFPEAVPDPKSLHVFFLAESPDRPNLASLNAIKSENETFALEGRAFYLHAPDGIGRSKLAQRAERLLGVDATGRNWRTVTRVLAMARELE
jgi:uncharacterized protein (DUF1697 family)